MTRKTVSQLLCFAAVSGFLVLTPGHGAELLDKARAEGRVVLYSCPGRENVEPVVREFERLYAGVKVQVTYGKGSQLQEKIRSEGRAGKPTADIHSCGWNGLYQFGLEGHLDKYPSPQLSQFEPSALDKSGLTLPHSAHIYGLVVNTRWVSAEETPRSWADLADPKWKGKLAIQDPRPGGGGFSWFVQTLTDPNLGESYLRKMAQQKIFLGRTNDLVYSLLARGEYFVHIAGTEERASAEAPKSAPVKFLKPRDGAFYTRVSFGLVKNAPHPNAAKLYIDFALSEAGQKAVAETGYLPLRKGVPSSLGTDALQGVRLAVLQTEEGIKREPEYAKKLKEILLP
jgi:iron(III) transport system substrate-binding protein